MATQRSVNLNINTVTKKVTRTGDQVASRETVEFTISNLGGAAVADLKLEFSANRKLLAETSSFTLSGSDAVGTVDFETTNMVAFFNGATAPNTQKVNIALYDVSANSDQLINDTFEIQKDPYEDSFTSGTTNAVGTGNVGVSGATTADTFPYWEDTSRNLSAAGRVAETVLSGSAVILTYSKAVKDYVDSAISSLTSTVSSHWADTLKRAAGDFIASISEKTSVDADDRFLIEDSGASYAKKYLKGTNLPGINSMTASLTSVVVSGFTGFLSGVTANVQAMLAAIDAIVAADVPVDASGFSGNLSGTDDEVQTCMETIDAMSTGVEYYEYYADTYANFRDAVEGGAYVSVFLANGTITVTDDEVQPIVVHANCKLIHGESSGGAIIDADGTANTSIQAVLYGHDDLTVENIKIIGQTSGSGDYAFQGQISYRVGASAYSGDANKATKFINCQVASPDGAGNQLAFGFANADCYSCHVNGNSLVSGYTGCCSLTRCVLTLCHNIGFYQCSKLASCVATDTVSKGYLQCTQLTNCRAFTTTIGFETCVYMSSCESRIASSQGFNACSNMSSCYNVYGASIGYNNCTYMSYDCTDSGTSPTAFSGCSFVPASFRDSTDNTKIGAHDYSGITTGTTRTFTWPDKDGTVAMTSDVTGGGITDVVEKTADYTILDSDNDTLFVLGPATAADKTFTLPTLGDNTDDTFHVKNRSDYILTLIGEQVATDAVEAGTTTTNITATSHSAVIGHVFNMTSGDEVGEYRIVTAIVDVDNFTVAPALTGTPTATETFELREAIDGQYSKTLGDGETLSVYSADITRAEWLVV